MHPIRTLEISLLPYESREAIWDELPSRQTPDARAPTYVFVEYFDIAIGYVATC